MKTNTEILRLLHNIIRTGVITDVDHEAARARVQTGHNHTDWLPWKTPRAGTTREWTPPTEGEQVLLFSPGGDLGQGIIFSGLFSSEHPAPSAAPEEHTRVYPDGTTITYNHESHELAVTVPEEGALNITVNGHCSVNAKTIDLGEPDDLEPSVRGNQLAQWVVSALTPWLNNHQHIGNMGSPTSPASDGPVGAFQPGEAEAGGSVYSTKNRNQ